MVNINEKLCWDSYSNLWWWWS